jgi:superfamily II DNA/RNA helicase
MQGSGKTLSYLVPVLNALCNSFDKGTYDNIGTSLILLPTRELAVQVENVLKTVINRLKTVSEARITTCTISGGFSVDKQIRMLGSSPKIVIATIGRLWDILQNGKSEEVKKITGAQFLILDEVDRIIDLGQMKEMENVLKFIDDP